MKKYNVPIETEGLILDDKLLQIYTDGSYKLQTKEFSYAFVIMFEEKVVDVIAHKEKDVTGSCHHNGEITSIIEAVRFVERNNCKAIIYTDSIHAFNIVDRNEIKSKREIYKDYKDFMMENKQYYKLEYIKGHNKIIGNQYANRAARMVLRET